MSNVDSSQTLPFAQDIEQPTEVTQIPVGDIEDNPFQPRQTLTPESVTDITDTLATSGLISPIVVRLVDDGDGHSRYQMVCGHRRRYAMQVLGIPTIAANVRDLSDQDVADICWQENYCRKSLEPIETADFIVTYMKKFNFTQNQTALGLRTKQREERQANPHYDHGNNDITRDMVATAVKVMTKCTPEVIGHVRAHRLLYTHAIHLARLEAEAQNILALQAIDEGLNPTRLHRVIDNMDKRKASANQTTLPVFVKDARDTLKPHFHGKISYDASSSSGVVSLRFKSEDDLATIIQCVATPTHAKV